MLDNVSYQVDPEKAHQTFRSKKTKENFLWEIAKSELEAKYEILGTDEVIAQFQRMAILKAIDENWVEQVDYLQQLRMALSGQYTSQKNPLVEFFQEAYQSFERMKEAAKEQMVRNLLLSRVEINKKGKLSCISHKRGHYDSIQYQPLESVGPAVVLSMPRPTVPSCYAISINQPSLSLWI